MQTVYFSTDQPNQDLNIVANLTMKSRLALVSIDKDLILRFRRHAAISGHNNISVPRALRLARIRDLTFTTHLVGGTSDDRAWAQVAINLTIGTGTFEKYSVPLIQFPDIQEGQSPAVHVKFENDGNVPEGFDGATYELYDQYDSVRLAYVQKSTGFPTTAPFTIADYNISSHSIFILASGSIGAW